MLRKNLFLKFIFGANRKYIDDEINPGAPLRVTHSSFAAEAADFGEEEDFSVEENGYDEEKTGLSDLNRFSLMAFHPGGYLPFLKRLFGMAILIGTLMFAAPGVQAKGLFSNAMAFTGGIYSAEGFGSNFYFGLRYNHFFSKWRYFVEGSIGVSSLKSQVLQDLAAFQVFDSEKLLTYEFLLGYDMAPLGNFPFIVAGVAGLNQGGQSKFAYVIGLGKQIPLAQFFKTKRLGLRYDIRDQIFKQQINDANAFTAHNLVFSLGLSCYF